MMHNEEKATILLVDDRPENLLALEAMLDSLGQILVRASSGEEALKCVLDQEFAVILLDVQMPDIDGFEIARLIKQRKKSGHAPIIFITAMDHSSAKAIQGYSVGAVDYLFKPIVPEVLRAKVATFIELYQKTKQAQRQTEWIEKINRELKHQLTEVTRLNQELAEANARLEQQALERQQAQEALQRSEKLYRTLARNLPNTAVVLFDHNLRYVIAEGALLADRFDLRETLEGKTADEVLPAEMYAFWEPNYRAALAGEETIREETFGERVFFIQMLPVKDEHNQIFAGMGVVQDITKFKNTEDALREMNEELEQKIRARTADLKATNDELANFTYIVSHDLRSPLVNLKGFASELRSAASLIRDDPCVAGFLDDKSAVHQALDIDIPEALSFIESAVTRMDHLTNAVLTLSRLGRRELTIESIEMNSLIQVILGSMAHQIKQQQVTVAVGQLPEFQADRLAAEQIVGNLLSNAVKYLCPERFGEIRIWGEATVSETILHVSDNGRGIAEEDIHKVFEPFRRAGRQDVPGDGMGLAYVQVLVRRHGGRIWFTSEPDAGSTFSFSIPYRTQG